MTHRRHGQCRREVKLVVCYSVRTESEGLGPGQQRKLAIDLAFWLA